MKIAIISDSHDNEKNLALALKKIDPLKINTIIHCGDLCAPFMLKQLGETKKEIHICFGYIDGAKHAYYTYANTVKNVHLHGDYGIIEIEGKKIVFVHEPEIANAFAFSGKYDAVFYGHDHTAKITAVGKTILVNPGELLGRKGKPSFAVYDTKTNKAEIVDF